MFLVFSLVWSFKTCAKTSIKIKLDAKTFLPFFPKFLLFWRYIFVFLIRVGCIVTYFAPFVGNLGVMNHYQAETLSLDANTLNSFGTNGEISTKVPSYFSQFLFNTWLSYLIVGCHSHFIFTFCNKYLLFYIFTSRPNVDDKWYQLY